MYFLWCKSDMEIYLPNYFPIQRRGFGSSLHAPFKSTDLKFSKILLIMLNGNGRAEQDFWSLAADK